MPITNEQAGIYRLLARTVRWHVPGKGQTEISRPGVAASDGSIRYTDSDDKPTLLALKAGDPLDLDFLLRSGVVTAYTPPAAAKPPKGADG